MLEANAQDEMDGLQVLAKANAAVKWCMYASEYLQTHGGKEWHYLLVPHDEVTEKKLYPTMNKGM